MSDLYGLHDKILTGKHKGKTPKSLILSGTTGIEYLLWWRQQKTPKGYPTVVFKPNLNHTLDQIIRLNPEKFSQYKPKHDSVEFDLYMAERRLKRKKAQEKERLEREKQKQKQLLTFKAIREKQKQTALINEQRERTYFNQWGTWA